MNLLHRILISLMLSGVVLVIVLAWSYLIVKITDKR